MNLLTAARKKKLFIALGILIILFLIIMFIYVEILLFSVITGVVHLEILSISVIFAF